MQNKKIVIVEDDPDVGQSLADFLTLSNYDVLPLCHSISFFFENLDLNNPPDVLLLDITIGNQNSINHLGKIKRLLPQVVIIIMTGHSNAEYLYQSLRQGIGGYFLKCDTAENLLAAIQMGLSDGAYLSPQATRKLLNRIKDFSEDAIKSDKVKIAADFYQLNKRETEILTGLYEGLQYKQIADKLHVSINTVRHYVVSLYLKLGVNKKTDLIRKINT